MYFFGRWFNALLYLKSEADEFITHDGNHEYIQLIF